MTKRFRVERFNDELEIEDNEWVADAEISREGIRGHSTNYALVGTSDFDPEGIEDEDPTCGVNGCSRTVSSPDEVCWQHEE